MKGDPKVVDELQQAASMEASLETQYHLDKLDLRYRGLKKLAGKISDFGEESECYLKEIMERIFYLEADPAYSVEGPAVRASVTDILQKALDAETAIVSAYNAAAVLAMEAKDDNTRNKFEHWIKWHEDRHIDWLERQLAQIALMGEIEYIKVQLGLN